MKRPRIFSLSLPSAAALLLSVLLLAACGSRSGGERAASAADSPAALASDPADSCRGRESIPAGRLTDEQLAAKRAANLILSEYLWLDGQVVRLALTADEAASLGVSSRHYAEALEEIAQTNRIVQEHLAAGDTIPMDIPVRPRKTFSRE